MVVGREKKEKTKNKETKRGKGEGRIWDCSLVENETMKEYLHRRKRRRTITRGGYVKERERERGT